MAEDSRDVLMKLELSGGGKFEAECTAVIPSASTDALSKDFKGTAQIGSLIRGNYFAIEDFSFDMGIVNKPAPGAGGAAGGGAGQEQADHTTDQVNKSRQETHAAFAALHDAHQDLHARVLELEEQLAEMAGHMAAMARDAGRTGRDSARGARGAARTASRGGGQTGSLSLPNVREAVAPGAGSTVEFQRFMNEGRAGARVGGERYPSDLEPIQITKEMDISSRLLFKYSKESTLFKSATIIKRKAIGADTLRTFLRMDFTDVMLIDLNWEDGDVIKETFKFVCRGATVVYCVETPSTDKDIKGGAPTSVLKAMPAVSWTALSGSS